LDDAAIPLNKTTKQAGVDVSPWHLMLATTLEALRAIEVVDSCVEIHR